MSTTVCALIYYQIDSKSEAEKIQAVKKSFLISDAKNTAESIIITGYEHTGDYLGYLIQLTGFYGRHKEIYNEEYAVYKKQVDSWSHYFENNRNNGNSHQYPNELPELRGLVTSGKANLEKMYEED